jgi:hypothetical protein
MAQLPTHKDILNRRTMDININLEEILTHELTVFDTAVSNNDVDLLLSRYPIRETPVLNNIADRLGLGRSGYESAVRKLIIDDTSVRVYYEQLLENLTQLMISN